MNELKLLLSNWHRAVIFLFMSLPLAVLAGNTSTEYFYRATANISGSGKVYVATTATDEPAYQSSEHTITGSQRSGDSGAQVTFYYYAQANDGYIFDHWAKDSANGTSVSTNPNYNVTETVISTNQNSRTTFTYYAVFKQQTGVIKVNSADNSKGTAGIINADNAVGDEVTLTAFPDVSNGVVFLGWRKGSATSGEYVSTDNPYTLTASSETQGTYYACFSEPLQRVYIRIQNKRTGKFLSLYGDSRAATHQGTISGNSFDDGFIFTNSLKMISEANAQGNPTTVFLRAGNPSGVGVTTNANLTSQGVAFIPTLVTDTDKELTMTLTADGSYQIFTTVSVNDNGTAVNLNSYLCDEGSDWPVMKVTDDPDTWYVYVLDENTVDGAFGANTKAKFTKDGKYYTTMYTTFPYQLLDGVKAYYLPASEQTSYDEATNTVIFSEVSSGKVPANTAVILECDNVQYTSGTAVTNRLLPLNETITSIVGESENLLKGYVSINGSTRENDKSRMYVLSYNNDKLGFYHYSKATMTPNKAYLELPESIDDNPLAKTMTFAFGQEDATGINISQSVSARMGRARAVYDLQGRKVADTPLSMKPSFKKGIFIYRGKKIIIK